ncbi:MAG: hypothetical protein IMW97_08015 [Firmicutes bacterium]|nr:hypothetical protein [Candidatus Fermentithermobacillaceae bacterium]
MDLADVVVESGARSIAIVGTAKNVGKTVTLNYLVGELSSRGYTLGLLSSGRDGERVDVLTGEPKPQVYLPRGSWVATAEALLEGASISLEVVDVWERPGVFGRLVLGRVVEPGLAELMGPRSSRQLASAVKKFLAYGADIVLVDGALDRRAAASPLVTEACIFATGASSADDLNSMVDTLESLVWAWSLPQPEDVLVAKLGARAIEKERVALVKLGRSARGEAPVRPVLVSTEYPTALSYEEDIAQEIDENTLALIVPGSVDRVLLQEVTASLAHLGEGRRRPIRAGTDAATRSGDRSREGTKSGWTQPPGTDGAPDTPDGIGENSLVADRTASSARERLPFYLVMRDPSCAMFRREHAVPLERMGGQLRVLEPGRVLAVTINPCSSGEMVYEPRKLVRYIGEKIKSVPVFDVVSGEWFWEEVA